jgi:hypothetical protein
VYTETTNIWPVQHVHDSYYGGTTYLRLVTCLLSQNECQLEQLLHRHPLLSKTPRPSRSPHSTPMVLADRPPAALGWPGLLWGFLLFGVWGQKYMHFRSLHLPVVRDTWRLGIIPCRMRTVDHLHARQAEIATTVFFLAFQLLYSHRPLAQICRHALVSATPCWHHQTSLCYATSVPKSTCSSIFLTCPTPSWRTSAADPALGGRTVASTRLI